MFGATRTGVVVAARQVFAPGYYGVHRLQQGVRRPLLRRPREPGEAGVGRQPAAGRVPHLQRRGARRQPLSRRSRLQRFQTLQDPLAPIVPPYHRVPQLNVAATYNDLGGIFDTACPASTCASLTDAGRRLARDLRADHRRAARRARLVPARRRWACTTTTYELDQSRWENRPSASVAIPWLSVDSGLVFERPTRWFGQSLTQTLEPRLFYVYVPYRNQDQIPLFDTALADFNYAQLFTENRFVGGDRFGDANQMTVARPRVSCRPTGRSRFAPPSASATTSRTSGSALTPTSPLRLASESDLLASVGGRATRALSFDATTQYNRYRSGAERYSVALRYAPEIAKVLNASYRFNARRPCSRSTSPASGRSRPAGTASGATITPSWTGGCSRAWPASSTTPAAGCSGRSCSGCRPRRHVSTTAIRLPARIQRRGPDRHRRRGASC